MNVGNARSALRGQIKILAIAAVPVEKPRLLILFGSVAGVYLGINVAVRDDQVAARRFGVRMPFPTPEFGVRCEPEPMVSASKVCLP